MASVASATSISSSTSLVLKDDGEEAKCFDTQQDRRFNLIDEYESMTCNDMEISGPIKVTTDGATIENLIIVVDPTSEGSKKND